MAEETPQDLEDLLDELSGVAKRCGDKVSVREVYCAVGERSFGPLLLVAGLLGMTPVSAVPGAPTVLALITILIAGQLLFGRSTLWLPRRLLDLSVGADKLEKTVKIARKPARFVDRVVRPRLTFLTGRLADRVVAGVCILVACAVPPLEFLPFMAFVPATAIAAFGLGIVARDGLLILVAFGASAGTLSLLGRQLLF
ncbi:probable exopolysaccharide synthesis protein [Phenylobacterium zucineum HLK1]|uniref:Probable exopolysaccharide synthesis protein n=1 Tax=Phenylobacterium zucineum (strain HLK1) TaxID=450851 RepID=B4R9B1_PHEZH|nr:exopolysaccharide biosynthesis protein [Phenylobacterium zucineum]ACG77781.1 probable exopolysaccharide synthesis protein [Phenylobacterium zucineum HLK1]